MIIDHSRALNNYMTTPAAVSIYNSSLRLVFTSLSVFRDLQKREWIVCVTIDFSRLLKNLYGKERIIWVLHFCKLSHLFAFFGLPTGLFA
jgi:hypothetical protein